jgi:hypothetical protein
MLLPFTSLQKTPDGARFVQHQEFNGEDNREPPPLPIGVPQPIA